MRESGMRGGCLESRDKQGGEAQIEKYLQDGEVNGGQKLTPGWKWADMKNQFTRNTAKFLLLPLPPPPFFLMVHLWRVIVMTKQSWTYANIGNY